jgi:predicted transcriptional regulator
MPDAAGRRKARELDDSFTLRLPAADRAGLERLAEEQDRPASYVARLAIRRLIEEHERERVSA